MGLLVLVLIMLPLVPNLLLRSGGTALDFTSDLFYG